MPGSPDHSRAARRREETEKAMDKVKGRSQRTGRAFFGDEQAQDPEWWSQEDFAWWSEGKKGKKGKAMMAFRRVVFALTRQIKAQARIIPRTKARERTKQEKARKTQSGLSASETPNEEGYGHA